VANVLEGTEVEVIDLAPRPPTSRRRRRCEDEPRVVVHEDKVHGGCGGEIAAQIGSRLFARLDAPVERVGSEFTPVGFNRILERAILPSPEKLLAAARKTLAY
jgi:2-oxoisovalerate dehydrogenase E1 component